MLDGHLNREPAADLAVVDAQRANLSLALGNSNVTRSIVSHQYDIVVEINRIVLREGTTPSETIHDLHGLSVLDFVFAGHGRSEEHTSELQSHSDLVCRLLLEKKKKKTTS